MAGFFYPASLILSLIQYSLALFLLAFKLLTSPFATALHIAAFILSPVGYLFQFMLAPFFAITAIAIKLEVCPTHLLHISGCSLN